MDKTLLTDEELILAFQNGDRDAYNHIVNRYKDRLTNFLYRFTYDIVSAEDLAQDTLLKVYINKDSYKEIAKFSTWIYTIASNLAKTELRKIKRRKTYTISDLSTDDREFVLHQSDVESFEDEEDTLVSGEILQKCLNDLDNEFKNIIILRDIQELSYDEISKILKIPLGTVKSRINRGRFKLKDLLKQKGVVLY
jgi:RNA polymerase sigma-70 factor (ECF subfamily)